MRGLISILLQFILHDYVFSLEKVYISKYLDTEASGNTELHVFHIIPRIGVQKCIENCESRKRCHFINFASRANVCLLLAVDGGGSLSTDDVSSRLEEMPGYMFGIKEEWSMGETDICTACSDIGPCPGAISSDGTCKSSGCKNPIQDGTVSYGTEFIPNNSIKYHCNTSFKSHNISTATCMDNGQWTPIDFTCTYDCGQPHLNGGYFTAVDGTEEGMSAQLYCYSGYVLTGDDVITCTVNGWTGSATCTYIDCGDPTPQYGFVNDTVFTYGSVLHASCKTGLVLSGHSIITCQADGNWSGNPTCDCDGSTFFGSSCYEVSTSLSWTDAKGYCESIGSHLAFVETSEEQTFLKSLISSTNYIVPYWIGGGDSASEGEFKWTDGTLIWKNNVEYAYTNWNPGQPDGAFGGEDCLQIIPEWGFNYRWNDENCADVRPGICELDLP